MGDDHLWRVRVYLSSESFLVELLVSGLVFLVCINFRNIFDDSGTL